MLVVLPLFPAQPMLGPIYVQIDRFMPPDFPLLLVVPALCIDIAMRRVRGHDWRAVARRRRRCSSLAFVAAAVAVCRSS